MSVELLDDAYRHHHPDFKKNAARTIEPWLGANVSLRTLRHTAVTWTAQRLEDVGRRKLCRRAPRARPPKGREGCDMIRGRIWGHTWGAMFSSDREPVGNTGGRYWDRTSDPYDVNVVLYR